MVNSLLSLERFYQKLYLFELPQRSIRTDMRDLNKEE